MAEKPYEWVEGATLEDHSRRKHKILREYFFQYLTVRCQLPQMEKFRLAIVDGFAGGGRYRCGASGSPLIFIEELRRAIEAVNTHRTAEGLGLIEVECLLVLNDFSQDALEALKTHIAPLQAEIAENVSRLHLRIEYLNQTFEDAYPTMKQFLEQGRFRNVLFNLDQCGHSKVSRSTLIDIMHSYPSVEVFYTFAIQSLLTYLFDVSGRQSAREQLLSDIPRLVSESGDVIGVSDFYAGIYNATPAHSEDIHQAIIENPDLQVITPAGGERRSANAIAIGDMLKLKQQKSFFPFFAAGSPDKAK